MRKKIRWWLGDNWQAIILIGVSLVILVFTFTFQLGQLTERKLSIDERQYAQSTLSGQEIFKNPVFLPHKVLTYSAQKLTDSVAAARLPSAMFGVVFVLAAIYALRRVYSRRTVFLAVCLLLFNGWLLSAARLALPTISFTFWLPAAVAIYMLTQMRSRVISSLLIVVIAGICLYIPSFIWLLLAALIVFRKELRHEVRQLPVWFTGVCIVWALLLIGPLIYGILNRPSLGLELLGFPSQINSLQTFLPTLVRELSALFWRNSSGAAYTLGTLPQLSILMMALVSTGIYTLRYSTRKQIGLALAVCFISLIFIGLGVVQSIILLPIIYGLAIVGLAFLLVQWFTVFPRNPIVRSVGVLALSLLVLVNGFYYVQRYFIAWPHTPETRRVFDHHLIK